MVSLHPAVKDVAAVVITAANKDDGPEEPPAVQAFVALKNPLEECEALLDEIKTFTNGRPTV